MKFLDFAYRWKRVSADAAQQQGSTLSNCRSHLHFGLRIRWTG